MATQADSSTPKDPCPDCGVAPGQLHAGGCDIERCAQCGMQAVSCGCERHTKNPRPRLAWSGVWPGTDECREFGWWSRFVKGSGWVPCEAEHPQAQPDLNRLVCEADWDAEAGRFVRKPAVLKAQAPVSPPPEQVRRHASALSRIVVQLNVPYGNIVSDDQLRSVLQKADILVVDDPVARAIIGSMFVECTISTILTAAAEVGAERHSLESIYRQYLKAGEPVNPAWEELLKEWK